MKDAKNDLRRFIIDNPILRTHDAKLLIALLETYFKLHPELNEMTPEGYPKWAYPYQKKSHV